MEIEENEVQGEALPRDLESVMIHAHGGESIQEGRRKIAERIFHAFSAANFDLLYLERSISPREREAERWHGRWQVVSLITLLCCFCGG